MLEDIWSAGWILRRNILIPNIYILVTLLPIMLSLAIHADLFSHDAMLNDL